MMSFKVNASNHDPKKFGEPFGYWYLHDDIGEWLMNHGIISIHCSLCFDVHSEVWSLCVPERVALLFKLTWGGR